MVRNINKLILSLILVCSSFYNCFSQDRIKEAEKHLPSTKGNERVALLNELSNLYYDIDKNKSILYTKEVADLTKNNLLVHSSVLYQLGNLYRHTHRYSLALEAHSKSLKIRKELDDASKIAKSYNNIGEIYKIYQEYEVSLHYLDSALQIRKQLELPAEIAYSLNNIGSVYWSKKDQYKALEFYLKALEIRSKLKKPAPIASSFSNLGNVYKSLNKYNKALEYYRKALVLRKEIGDQTLISYTLNDIGGIYWRLNKFSKSIHFYEQALTIRRAEGDLIYLAATLKNLGNVYKDTRKTDSALIHYQEALSIYKKLENIKAQADIYSLIGCLHKYSKEYDKSNEYHETAIVLYQSINDSKGIAHCSNSIGEVLMKYHKSPKAEQFLLNAYQRAKETKDQHLQKISAENLFEFYSSQGKYKKALAYYQEFSNTQYDSIVEQLNNGKITELVADLEISQNKTEIKHLKAYNKIQSYIIYLFVLILLLCAVIGYIIFRNNKLRKESGLALKSKNAELEEINSRLKESEIIQRDLNLTKDKILSIISKDLQVPFLQLIQYSNQLIKDLDESSGGKYNKIVSEIQDVTNSTYSLVKNLLLWSASKSGRKLFHPVYFDLNEVFQTTFDHHHTAIQLKKLKLSLSIEPELKAYADRNAISEVLRNLLSNAIKFSYPEGKIEICVKEKKYLIEIDIKDYGIGMNSSHVNNLFHLDNNYSATGTYQEKGAGIGLLLCKEYIEKNGGKIWAESEEKKGSNFFITIPKTKKLLDAIPLSHIEGKQ